MPPVSWTLAPPPPRGRDGHRYQSFEHTLDPVVVRRMAAFLAAGVRLGALRPAIDRAFAIEDVAEAHRHLEKGSTPARRSWSRFSGRLLQLGGLRQEFQLGNRFGSGCSGEDDQPQVAVAHGEEVAVQRDRPNLRVPERPALRAGWGPGRCSHSSAKSALRSRSSSMSRPSNWSFG